MWGSHPDVNLRREARGDLKDTYKAPSILLEEVLVDTSNWFSFQKWVLEREGGGGGIKEVSDNQLGGGGGWGYSTIGDCQSRRYHKLKYRLIFKRPSHEHSNIFRWLPSIVFLVFRACIRMDPNLFGSPGSRFEYSGMEFLHKTNFICTSYQLFQTFLCQLLHWCAVTCFLFL